MSLKNPIPDSSDGRTICSVCAWRGTCQKKYSFDQSGSAKCPDYTRDLSLPSQESLSTEGPHEN